MNKPLLLAAAASAALFALSACNNEPEVVNGPEDPMAEEIANRGEIQAPPMITSQRQYRCADNSLYVVEFYNNNTATIRVGNAQAAATILNAGDGGAPPYTAEGYTLSGNGERVTINGKNCHT